MREVPVYMCTRVLN